MMNGFETPHKYLVLIDGDDVDDVVVGRALFLNDEFVGIFDDENPGSHLKLYRANYVIGGAGTLESAEYLSESWLSFATKQMASRMADLVALFRAQLSGQ